MSEREKFQPQIESADTSKISSKEGYLKRALENLQITSRTARGVVDVSVSKDKAREIQDISEREVAFREFLAYLGGTPERVNEFREWGIKAQVKDDLLGAKNMVEKILKQD